MNQSNETHTLKQTQTLPSQIPVFPLTGALLLPGMHLPLHVFETRYRNMVRDVVHDAGCIGMVQPLIPREDNLQPSADADPNPPLHMVGCMGRIVRCELFEDGRSVLLLRGWRRFKISGELPLKDGYRVVVPSHEAYESDDHEDQGVADTARAETFVPLEDLVATIQGVAEQVGIQIHLEQLNQAKPWQIVNGLCMQLPLHPAEKQALLEAPSLAVRGNLLCDMLVLLKNASTHQASTLVH